MLWKNIKESLKHMSTYPAHSATHWPGGKSIFSWILLWSICICRYLSLLQLVKAIYRLHKASSKDVFSKRSNVPPIIPEIYFLIWFIGMLFIEFSKNNNILFKVFTIYYLFESEIWILYYCILRRFYEEKYTINHYLEYFVNFIVIIPTQAIALDYLYKQYANIDILSGLLGNPIGNVPAIVGIMGALNAAVIISMIISSFPGEERKRRNLNNIVIGTGDVVCNRLLPRLAENNEVRIYSDQSEILYKTSDDGQDVYKKKNCSIDYKVQEDEIRTKISSIKDIDASLDNNSIVWIETPSYLHGYYLNSILYSNAGMIVVEKPATVLKDEIANFRRITACEDRRRIFFLSYYLLEKALPLTYIHRNYMDIYERYLSINNLEFNEMDYNGIDSESPEMVEKIKRRNENHALLIQAVSSLGKLESIEVNIHEMKDYREWTYEKQFGGQLMETFIHNVIIASEFAGSPKQWKNVCFDTNMSTYQYSDIDKKPLKISMTAENEENVRIILDMVKNGTEKKRWAVLKYSDGMVNASFDDKPFAEIQYQNHGKPEKVTVEVRNDYLNKYAIQTSLVEECFKNGISPEGIDGLDGQIDIIEWLLSKMS